MAIIGSVKQRYEDLSLRQKEIALGYALIAPSVILVAITLVYPLLYNFYLSFTDVPLTPAESPTWVGTEHYVTLLTDPEFYEATFNTLVFAFFSTAGSVVLGLFVAMLFSKDFFAQKLARGLVLLPYVAPTIAAAFMWRWIWDPAFGIAPFYLGDIIAIFTDRVDLRNTLGMVIAYETWRYFPFTFLIILARLQSIPEELYEAAEVDGASRFAKFKDITLPEVKFVMATVFLLRWIWNFNSFASVWLFTREVPILGVFVYQTGFAQFEQGYAAAVSMIMLVFLAVFLTIYVKWALDW